MTKQKLHIKGAKGTIGWFINLCLYVRALKTDPTANTEVLEYYENNRIFIIMSLLKQVVPKTQSHIGHTRLGELRMHMTGEEFSRLSQEDVIKLLACVGSIHCAGSRKEAFFTGLDEPRKNFLQNIEFCGRGKIKLVYFDTKI